MVGSDVIIPFSSLQDVNAQHSSSAGQSRELPDGHLIPHCSSASAQDSPQKKVKLGSAGSKVGLSVGFGVIVGLSVGISVISKKHVVRYCEITRLSIALQNQ
jgi:hypothetical protein